MSTLLREAIKANHVKKHTQSLAILRKIYPYFQYQNNNEELAYCAYYIGINLKAIREYGQALPYLKEAYDIAATSAASAALQTTAQLNMGICEEALGQYASAIKSLTRLTEQPDIDEDEENIMLFRARLHLCRCIMMQGNYTLAALKLQRMQSTFSIPHGNNPIKIREYNETQALMYQLLGMSLALSEDSLKARPQLEIALTLYQSMSDTENHQATIAQYLGTIYANLDLIPKSILYLSQAKEYFQTTGDIPSLYFVNLALALSYMKQKNRAAVQNCIQESLSITETCATESDHIVTQCYMAMKYFSPKLMTLTPHPEIDPLRITLANIILSQITTYEKMAPQSSLGSSQSSSSTFMPSGTSNNPMTFTFALRRQSIANNSGDDSKDENKPEVQSSIPRKPS
jgi:tetratricopeptide (TPR) repeat protein